VYDAVLKPPVSVCMSACMHVCMCFCMLRKMPFTETASHQNTSSSGFIFRTVILSA